MLGSDHSRSPMAKQNRRNCDHSCGHIRRDRHYSKYAVYSVHADKVLKGDARLACAPRS